MFDLVSSFTITKQRSNIKQRIVEHPREQKPPSMRVDQTKAMQATSKITMPSRQFKATAAFVKRRFIFVSVTKFCVAVTLMLAPSLHD